VAGKVEYFKLYDVWVGGVHPNHISKSSTFNTYNFVVVPTANEMKVGLCNVKNCLARLSPVNIIAAHPQIMNHKCDAYNDNMLKCASDIEYCHVLSKSLAIERDFIVHPSASFVHGMKNAFVVVD
jgi:hypothetical protein